MKTNYEIAVRHSLLPTAIITEWVNRLLSRQRADPDAQTFMQLPVKLGYYSFSMIDAGTDLFLPTI